MEDLPPLSSLMGSTHLGTKTLWKINQPSDLFLKNPVKKGNSLGLLQRDVNLVEAKYSRFVNREIITSDIERLDVNERLAINFVVGRDILAKCRFFQLKAYFKSYWKPYI